MVTVLLATARPGQPGNSGVRPRANCHFQRLPRRDIQNRRLCIICCNTLRGRRSDSFTFQLSTAAQLNAPHLVGNFLPPLAGRRPWQLDQAFCCSVLGFGAVSESASHLPALSLLLRALALHKYYLTARKRLVYLSPSLSILDPNGVGSPRHRLPDVQDVMVKD